MDRTRLLGRRMACLVLVGLVSGSLGATPVASALEPNGDEPTTEAVSEPTEAATTEPSAATAETAGPEEETSAPATATTAPPASPSPLQRWKALSEPKPTAPAPKPVDFDLAAFNESLGLPARVDLDDLSGEIVATEATKANTAKMRALAANAPTEGEWTLHDFTKLFTRLGIDGKLPKVNAPDGSTVAPSPTSGPTTGGTLVDVGVEDLRFAQIDTGGSLAAGIDTWGRLWGWGTFPVPGVSAGSSSKEIFESFTAGATGMPIPLQAPDGVRFTKIDVGDTYGPLNSTYPAGTPQYKRVGAAVALDSQGRAWTFGGGFMGQLGNGTVGHSPATLVPATMPAGVTFTDVTAGHEHTLALDTEGRVWAWGAIPFTGLIDADWFPSGAMSPYDPELVPDWVRYDTVEGPDGEREVIRLAATEPQMVDTGEVRFRQISASGVANFAIATDGTGYSWGLRQYAGLGDGLDPENLPVDEETSTEDALRILGMTPHKMAFPADTELTKVDATLAGGLALDASGHAWSWGISMTDGDGTPLEHILNESNVYPGLVTPKRATLPAGTKFTDLSGYYGGAYAVDASGGLWSWGLSLAGELGNGKSVMHDAIVHQSDPSYEPDMAAHFTPRPTRVPTEGPVADVELSEQGAGIILGTNGRAIGYGVRQTGQLGDGGYEQAMLAVAGMNPVCEIDEYSGDPMCSFDEPPNIADFMAMVATKEPVQIRTPDLTFDQVTFGDRKAGPAKASKAERPAIGTETVVAPAHDPGTVDVTADMSWRVGPYSGPATPVSWPQSYTYIGQAEPEPTTPPTPEPTVPTTPAPDPEPTPSPTVAPPAPKPPASPTVDSGGSINWWPLVLGTALIAAAAGVVAAAASRTRRRRDAVTTEGEE